MIQPGATIGILGGGQLGRMTGLAARSLGYDVHVLDPDPNCPASAIASRTVAARFDDADAAASLAEQCAVVTLEIEQIGTAALAAVAARTPLRPGAEPVHVIQDRIRQKTWLAANGFPVAAFRAVASLDESVAAFDQLGRCIFKSTSGGYDGRGEGHRLAEVARVLAGNQGVVGIRLGNIQQHEPRRATASALFP